VEQKTSDPKSAKEEDGAEGLETGYSTARELISKEHGIQTNRQEDALQDDGSWLPNFSNVEPNRDDLIRYLQYDHPISIQKFHDKEKDITYNKQRNFSCCAKITTKDYYCKLLNPFYGIRGCCVSKRPPIILDSEEIKFVNFINSGATDVLNSTNDDADVLPPPKPRS